MAGISFDLVREQYKSALAGRFLISKLTKSRVQHVKCHPITLFGSGNSHKSLVAVILRFVDFNDTTTDLSNFIDLLAALADNGANHIIRNENLLR